MSTSALIGQGNGATIAPQPVDGSGMFNLVATLVCENAKLATITGIVGSGAALNGLKVSTAAVPGGTHLDRFTNADFNQWLHATLPYTRRSDTIRSTGVQPTSNPNYLSLSPSEQTAWDQNLIQQDIHTTPAGESFQITIDLTGIAEVKIWAASTGAGTTLAIEAGA